MNETQIDRYLLNLLTPKEKEAFEAQLKTNKILAREVTQHRELLEDIEEIGRIELKSKLKEIHKDFYPYSEKPKTKFRKLLFRVAVAAVFLGVLSIGWWWLQQVPTNTELFSQNFEPFELSLNQRSEGDIIFSKIEDLYFQGKYKQAIPLFEDALNGSNLQSSQVLLGLGISYLQTEQPKKAIIQFDSILVSKDFNFEDEAQWYLGLSYLKLNDIDNAKFHLNLLASDSKRDHYEAAKKLISQFQNK